MSASGAEKPAYEVALVVGVKLKEQLGDCRYDVCVVDKKDPTQSDKYTGVKPSRLELFRATFGTDKRYLELASKEACVPVEEVSKQGRTAAPSLCLD